MNPHFGEGSERAQTDVSRQDDGCGERQSWAGRAADGSELTAGRGWGHKEMQNCSRKTQINPKLHQSCSLGLE